MIASNRAFRSRATQQNIYESIARFSFENFSRIQLLFFQMEHSRNRHDNCGFFLSLPVNSQNVRTDRTYDRGSTSKLDHAHRDSWSLAFRNSRFKTNQTIVYGVFTHSSYSNLRENMCGNLSATTVFRDLPRSLDRQSRTSRVLAFFSRDNNQS